jgi:hypothetical protein
MKVTNPASEKFSVGDKIRLKQGGSYKYFYVSVVGSGSIALQAGTDYTLTDTTITDAYYSKGNAVGFPGVFATTVGYFTMNGNSMVQYGSYNLTITSGNESGGNTFNLAIPYPNTSYNISFGGIQGSGAATHNETPFINYNYKTTSCFDICAVTRLGVVTADRYFKVEWRTEGKI